MSDQRTKADAADKPSHDLEQAAGESAEKRPAAGPHAKPHLTDEEKTPGAGTLPDVGEDGVGDGASS